MRSSGDCSRLLVRHAWLPLGLLLLAASLSRGQEQEEGPSKGETKKPRISESMRQVEVEFTGSGGMQMVLEIDELALDSPYGKLTIPVEEIQTIEFATRYSPEVMQQVEAAILDLGSRDFDTREAAAKQLFELQEKAYPALGAATKHPDLEVAQRARDLSSRLRNTLPAERLEVREFDVVTTAHSTISGKIPNAQIAVKTSQFGFQQLKLTDVRSLRSVRVAAIASDDGGEVRPNPGNLSEFRDQIGKTFAFEVMGRGDGTIWGTGIYTTDSQLATAAVHAGALKIGQTKVVRVMIVPPPPAFAGSTQNGITSSPYGAYPGAFQVLVPDEGPARGRGRARAPNAGAFGGGSGF